MKTSLIIVSLLYKSIWRYCSPNQYFFWQKFHLNTLSIAAFRDTRIESCDQHEGTFGWRAGQRQEGIK